MRRERWVRVFLFVIIAALTVTLFRILSTGLHRPEIASSSGDALAGADIEMDRFTLKQIQDGETLWTIRADRAELFESARMLSLSQLQATLRTSDGTEIQFSGDRGRLDTVTRDFEIMNDQTDMVVLLNNGFSIQTRALQWKDSAREVRSDRPVLIIGQGFQIRGQRMNVTLADQQLYVDGDVNVTLEH